jgi:lysozyme
MSIEPVIVDLYHGNSVNFAKLKAAGIWGVIHKAAQGVRLRDWAYASRRAIAEQLGFLWGAYDFSTGDNVQDNVKEFIQAANPGPQTSMWLDFENNVASEMSADQAYEFLDTVSQKLGRACGIYGGNRIREKIPQHDPRWIDMAKVTPLWQARYIRGQPADTAALFKAIPPIPPWTANTFIQYTGDGVGPTPHLVAGLEDGADLNVFNGSHDQLVQIWAGKALRPNEPVVAALA